MEVWSAIPKSKKHKKKKAGNKSKPNGDLGKPNGIKVGEEHENDDIEEEEQEPKTPTATIPPSLNEEPPAENNNPANGGQPTFRNSTPHELVEATVLGNHAAETGHSEKLTSLNNMSSVSSADTEARLDALANERTALRDEVAQLRRSLEQIQGKHEDELGSIRTQFEETQGEKEHAEAQYRNLLGRVNTIRSQLGERLKADAVCILAVHLGQGSHFKTGRLSTSKKSDR